MKIKGIVAFPRKLWNICNVDYGAGISNNNPDFWLDSKLL